MSEGKDDPNQSPLRARLEQRRREMLAQEQRQRREQLEREGKKPEAAAATVPPAVGLDIGLPPHTSPPGTGPLRALPKRSPYAAAQIIDWYLPRTRRLNVLLNDPALVLSDIPSFDPALFEIAFGRVNAIVNELESQYKIRDEADHPRLVDAATSLLSNKVVTARFMLEMFGHLKHPQGDNSQVWELWENPHKNAANVILYRYLQSFEESFQARFDDERQYAQGQAIAAFLTYAAPTAYFGSQHPRYLAIRKVLARAVQLAEVSQAKVDVPPSPDEL